MKLCELINLNPENKKFSELQIDNIQIDSRKCNPKSIFVCIKGFVTDGHQYIPSAIQNGAQAIIIQDDSAQTSNPDVAFVKVDNTREILGPICSKLYHDPSSRIAITGITGTKGKTTTSYMIKAIYDLASIKTGLIGTMFNIIGDKKIPAVRTTPEANEIYPMLSSMIAAGSSACIMEVSSQGLNLSRVGGLIYEIAIFTNLSPDHIGANEHANMEEYANAKAKLFTMCRNAIINIDNSYSHKMLDAAANSCEKPRIFTISVLNQNADFVAQNIEKHPQGVEYDIAFRGEKVARVKVPIPGLFSVYNSMTAFATAFIQNIATETIIQALAEVFVPGKAENVPTGMDFSVLIDYAHNPDSIANIIDTVREYARRTVILFGCGGDRNRPRALMGKTAGEHADYTIITSDNPRSEDPESIVRDIEKGILETNGKYICIVDRTEAIEYAIMNAKPGDVIILAGKGHETEQIFKDKTVHFDERIVVANALKKRKEHESNCK